MSGRAEDYERTMAFAEIALGQMKALRQPATARNYEIWYTYATGHHPALNQQVNATIKANGTISEADLAQIYESYLSPARLTDRIDEVGSQVKGEIDQIVAMIDAVAGSQSKVLRHHPRKGYCRRIREERAAFSDAYRHRPFQEI